MMHAHIFFRFLLLHSLVVFAVSFINTEKYAKTISDNIHLLPTRLKSDDEWTEADFELEPNVHIRTRSSTNDHTQASWTLHIYPPLVEAYVKIPVGQFVVTITKSDRDEDEVLLSTDNSAWHWPLWCSEEKIQAQLDSGRITQRDVRVSRRARAFFNMADS